MSSEAPPAATARTEVAETRVGPPMVPLTAAAAAVVASLLLLVLSSFATHVLGYVLAAVVPIFCVGLFRRSDLALRANPSYVPRPLVARLLPIILVVGVLAAVLHTWYIATEVAS